MEKKIVLLNPVVRWAVESAQTDNLRYLEAIAGVAKRIPELNEELTLPFIVDATTGKPVAVRVARLLYQQEPNRTVVIPVVVRAAPH